MQIAPITLTGRYVRLEPLTHAFDQQLANVGLEEELWRWIPTPVRTAVEMTSYIQTALDEQSHGISLPFVIIDQASGKAIGSTRYAQIQPAHRRMEIGWTWLAPDWQRTAANTEAKFLLLQHAFESLGCIRVELKTDSLNEKSRAAILRIGATQEGIFRNHMVTSAGRIRHTVYFSIIDSEWPAIKLRLSSALQRKA
jgi:RimJ/RimL family protein N-acetyltransferase